MFSLFNCFVTNSVLIKYAYGNSMIILHNSGFRTYNMAVGTLSDFSISLQDTTTKRLPAPETDIE